MKHVHECDLGQWPSALVVIADKRAYGRYIRRMCGDNARDCPPFPGLNAGLCQTLEQPGAHVILIAIGPQESDRERVLTLVHEATHAMRYALQHAAENEPGTETEAYLVEHILRQGLEALNTVQSRPS